jgi:archaellum component FlaC
MTNENNDSKESTQATDSTEALEFAGRKFPNTAEGLEQLKTYGNELSALVGKQSNEVGQSRKTIAKYQRMVEELPAPVKMILESEDSSQEAKLLAQFIAQDKLQAVEKANTSYHDKWYEELSGRVLEELPDLQNTYDSDTIDAVLRKHSIHTSEDYLGDAVKLFKGKIKAAPKNSHPTENVSVDASSPRGQRSPKEEQKAPNSNNAGGFFEALGIKS